MQGAIRAQHSHHPWEHSLQLQLLLPPSPTNSQQEGFGGRWGEDGLGGDGGKGWREGMEDEGWGDRGERERRGIEGEG